MKDKKRRQYWFYAHKENKNALADFKPLRQANRKDRQDSDEGRMDQHKVRQEQTNQQALKHTTRGGSSYLNTRQAPLYFTPMSDEIKLFLTRAQWNKHQLDFKIIKHPPFQMYQQLWIIVTGKQAVVSF